MHQQLRRLILFISLLVSCGCAHAADTPQWLTYPGGDGPGKGKRIVLIAADHEYRSEQSMPMMAKILSTHHGFDCTATRSVDIVGVYQPLESGFNYRELGVIPKPISAYK